MTRTTIVAEVVTADGTAAWTDAWAGPGYRSFQATPPYTFDDEQPGTIPVSIGHDEEAIGHVDYLEHDLGYGRGGIYAVAVIDGIPADVLDEALYCSPELYADAIATVDPYDLRSVGSMHATRAILHALALVDKTATLGATKVRAFAGDYRTDMRGWNMRTTPEIITRAAAAATHDLRYSRPPELRIHRRRQQHAVRTYDDRPPRGTEILHSAPYFGVLEVR